MVEPPAAGLPALAEVARRERDLLGGSRDDGVEIGQIRGEAKARPVIPGSRRGVVPAGQPVQWSQAALAALARQAFDLAFLDLRLREASGLELLPKLLHECPTLAVVIITAYANFDTAVQAVKLGAMDYLPKPFTPAQIRHVVEQVTERHAMKRRVADLEGKLAESVPETDLTTESPKMQAVLDVISRAAASDTAVLLRGESGTGKGVLARTLHAQSPRAGHPLVMVNCPTLTEELLASELFGHARGAFTGASAARRGYFAQASGGTLVLDEVAELPPAIQAKILRALQSGEIQPLGSKVQQVDVRVIACTHRDLRAEVAAGRFREDLYYRLAVIELRVPPLRERRGDIPGLADSFARRYAARFGLESVQLSPALIAALVARPWPGNVRELENCVARLVALSSDGRIDAGALLEPGAPGPGNLRAQVDAFERGLIEAALRAAGGNHSEAARRLATSRVTLLDKLKKHGLPG